MRGVRKWSSFSSAWACPVFPTPFITESVLSPSYYHKMFLSNLKSEYMRTLEPERISEIVELPKALQDIFGCS